MMATLDGCTPIGTLAPTVSNKDIDEWVSKCIYIRVMRERERDGGRDGAVHTVDLLADELVDVNDVLAAVNGRDLALAALVGSTGDDDLIVLADRDRANLFINTIFQLAYTC